jgi:nucleoside-diphosphate-sugar epimerase
MKVLLTGASGFLGQYIVKYLPQDRVTLGRGTENNIQADLAKEIPKLPEIDLIVHNAGLAHRVPKTDTEKEEFFQVNFEGTKNLLLAVDGLQYKPSTIVYISSVAVYGLDFGSLISENHKPNPQTPYAKSKWEAERLIDKYCKKNGIKLSILRLPLVAGAKQVPGNLGAMIKAIKKGYYFRIKGLNVHKSMVLADDVGKLIPSLYNKSGVFNLTDGVNPSLNELESYISGFFKKKVYTVPLSLIKFACKLGDRIRAFPINSYRLEKLSSSLTFDDTKAREVLGWKPSPVIGNLDLENFES